MVAGDDDAAEDLVFGGAGDGQEGSPFGKACSGLWSRM